MDKISDICMNPYVLGIVGIFALIGIYKVFKRPIRALCRWFVDIVRERIFEPMLLKSMEYSAFHDF